jgi:hypothetical protein
MRCRFALLPKVAFFVAPVVAVLAACGWRTGLVIGDDGAVPRADGGFDFSLPDLGGPDAGRPCVSDTECDDALACNGIELCRAGRCETVALPLPCDDGIPCTVDRCLEPSAICESIPDSTRCPPGTICDPAVGCRRVTCTPGDPGACDDGVFCNGREVCGPEGTCVPGMPPCPTGPCAPRCDEVRRRCVPREPDEDRDGFSSIGCGGEDCDDSNPRVNPGAREVCTGGTDDDCDGAADCRDADCRTDPACATCAMRETNCADRRDDDCDDLIDCLDPDCAGSLACGMTCTEVEVCGNGRDDDCDGTRDCDDPECAADPSCTCGPGPIVSREVVCNDGRDDDCDGATDCLDADCRTTEICRATCGRDIGSRVGRSVASGSNRTGTQEFDGSCSAGSREGREVVFVWTAPSTGAYVLDTISSTYDTVLYVLSACSGGRELACNDDVGVAKVSQVRIDATAGQVFVVVVDSFRDVTGTYVLNIAPVPPRSERGLCRDGRDNDRDGRTDCADMDCASDLACCAFMPEDCRNGRDDDCDGFADCDDTENCAATPFCTVDGGVVVDGGEPDLGIDAGRDAGVDAGADAFMCVTRELGIAACTNGRDDDCDTRVDCADPDCTPFPGGECCNGRDDDGDGLVDLFTCRCFSDAECVGVGSFEQVCWTRSFNLCAPRCNFVGGTRWCVELLGSGWTCDRGSGQCVAP